MKKGPPHRALSRRGSVPASLLAAALKAQSEGVFIAARRAGPRGLRMLFVNDSLCVLAGRPAGKLVGQPHGILHAEVADVARVRAWLRSTGAIAPLSGEGALTRPDGTTVSVAWSFDPLCDERGRMTHVVATYRDQTEKRRLQAAAVHAQRLDAVGRLAGGLAHDFHNLLSVINGYCEILASHVAANPQALRDVAEIHAAGRKAAALTQQLLAFSRRQPLDARVINLNTLIQDNARILGRLLGEAGRLELQLEPHIANVRTDPAQFQQVLLNLVLNARDALRDDGRVTIRTENRDADATSSLESRTYVALTVADNGIGMDAETQKHLFEPFYTTKPEGKGTGLGLALVYGVVQQSGGHISARSTPMAGSTFEILLPAVNAPVEPEPRRVSPLPSFGSSETVVLVESDDVVRKMLEGMLMADGYRVVAARSFSEAAAGVEQGRTVDLLICALDAEGERFARRLAADRPRLRLLCTANHPDRSPAPWLEPARWACVHKPFTLSELLRAARRLLDN